MRIPRKGPEAFCLAVALTLVLLTGCGGGRGIGDELEQVPGLSFLHVHAVRSFDTGLLPAVTADLLPLWLCDSLLARGSLGITLLGINLTDLSPQLQFLSSSIEAEELASIAAAGLDCGMNMRNGRHDLSSPDGNLMASVAGRDGWACAVIGTGADSAIDRWLALEPEGSLAADSGLSSISEGEADITVLVSENTISFLMFIPDGMLSRAEKRIMESVRWVIETAEPGALRFAFSFTDEPGEHFAGMELELLRSGGQRSSISIELTDTAISPDSLVGILLQLTGMGS